MSLLACCGIGLAVWCVLCLLCAWLTDDLPEAATFWIGLVIFVGLAWLIFAPETESGRERRLAREAQELAARTPHVIREKDGCKVYAFDANSRTHYFTRCGDQSVPTLTTHTESCGKNCTRAYTEEIK